MEKQEEIPWYRLFLMVVHEDFRKYIAEELIKDLNSKSVSPEKLEYNRRDLEHSLKIRLIYRTTGHKGWSYSTDPAVSNSLLKFIDRLPQVIAIPGGMVKTKPPEIH